MNTLEEEIDMTTDEALLSALTPRSLSEIELQPFSLMRQVISIDLCQFSGSTLFNAIVTVWVCTLTPTETLKAHEDITAARLAAFEWAEAQGYSIVNYQPVLDAYARLNRELEASTNARLKAGSEDGQKKIAGEQAPVLR